MRAPIDRTCFAHRREHLNPSEETNQVPIKENVMPMSHFGLA
jgi:hypothetical protein